MKNVSGDVVISKSVLELQCQMNASTSSTWCNYCFSAALTDSSNGSLKVWSGSGNIDVYVGQTGSAEVFSQSGEAWKLNWSHCHLDVAFSSLVRLDRPPLVHAFSCPPSMWMWCWSGAVCVRVPSSLRAEVDLVGSSVEVSPEVILQEAKRHATAGQTQVTGESSGQPCYLPRTVVHVYWDTWTID